MATALGPLPAAPAPVKHAHTNNVHSRQSLCVDPKLLSKRLEALQREKDAAQSRRDRRKSTPVSSFVPRHAAQHFASTTTPMTDKVTQSTKAKRNSGEPAAEKSSTVPYCSADGKAVLNPKQLYAALQIGMSEAEILAEPLSLVRLNSRDDLDRGEPLPAIKERRSSRSSGSDPTPKRSTSTKAYRPGDAAKRNASKRSSMLIDNSRLVAVRHGSQTVYERVEIHRPKELPNPFDDIYEEPQHLPAWRAQRDREAQMPYDLPPQNVPAHRAQRDREAQMPYDLPDLEEEQPSGTQRPKILQSDRPNWAQQSQCGEDMRHHFLQVPILHRRREKPADQQATQPRRPAPPRRHSSAPHLAAEPMLITNAVKLIKKEERKQRRQSVMGFFKKL